jgi:hypothetical protein
VSISILIELSRLEYLIIANQNLIVKFLADMR